MDCGSGNHSRGGPKILGCVVKLNLRSPLIIIAIVVGLIVLVGYFLPLGPLEVIRTTILRWAVILVAAALVVGVINLFQVHWIRMTTDEPGGIYSLLLVVALIVTTVLVGVLGPTAPISLWIFNFIEIPVESSLMALLAIILIYASARMLGRRLNLFSLFFIGTVLLILLSTAFPPGSDVPLIGQIGMWVQRVPVVAGVRGILLGVALGTVATGLRVLAGADRPYGD